MFLLKIIKCLILSGQPPRLRKQLLAARVVSPVETSAFSETYLAARSEERRRFLHATNLSSGHWSLP